MKRKMLLILGFIFIFFSMNVSALFTDVTEENTILHKAVSELHELKIVNGITETEFDTDSNVTRAQMAAFITRMMNKGQIPDSTSESTFSDVTDPVFTNAIIWANNEGIIKGNTETEFVPDGEIMLQDAYVMLVRALGYESKKTLEYPNGYITAAEKYGLNANIGENITYETPLTRGNVVILLYNALYVDMADGDVIIDKLYGKKEMKIVTFNIRCKYTGDGANSFIHRAGFIADKINKEKPDVIAMQEVTGQIIDMMKKLLPEYEFVGHGRNSNYGGEGLYTAVRRDSCTIVGWDSIWLSPEPYTPGSRFENQSQYPRICVQTFVRHKSTGKLMRVFNVHLDHISEEARIEGTDVIFDYIESYRDNGNYPYVVLGDFNAVPDGKVIEKYDNYPGISDVTKNIPVTFQSFGKKASKLDYIYMTDDLAKTVKISEAWSDESSGIFLSDHYPVCADMWID